MPVSTRPHNLRRSEIPMEIINHIKALRETHPRLGKEKIKVLLDKYCKSNKLKTISESTIGNIIKRHKFFFQKTGRIYHNPNSKWAQNRRKKTKRLRVKHPPKPKEFGHILSDTVQRVTGGIKDYFYSAIDAKLKFALTLHYKRLNSRNMKDFYNRFKTVYPARIKTWQSDNGAENLKEFEEVLKKDSIPHFFIYPNCPKINTYIERYNRTIQEEFINNHLDVIHDKELFNQKLSDYLIFYNTERPHKTLGLKSPIDYLIENGGMSHKSLTYTLPVIK
ncbi:MAG: transposase [Candidatus Omnitrophica bacterium]|nr:transposase [Candidatus Omnitrophota bacterium]